MNTTKYTRFYTAKAVDGGQNFYILQNQESVEAFLDWQKLQVDATIQDFTRNLITPEHWKAYEPICIKGIHQLARWELSQGRAAPLTAHTKAFDLFSETIRGAYNAIKRNDVVAVNIAGGWRYMKHNQLTDFANMCPNPFDRYTQHPTATILNIENDARMDSWVRDNILDDMSVLLRLYQLNEKQTQDIMSEFVDQGGDTLFVYTTASDEPQALGYTRAALAAGIDHFIFIDSTGDEPEIFEELRGIITGAGKSFKFSTFLEIDGPISLDNFLWEK